MIGYISSTQTVSDPYTGHLLHRATGSQEQERAENWRWSPNCCTRSVYKTLQRLTRPTKELPSPSLVYTPPHWGKEASMGGIFKPWPQAEYHITETTCQKFGNRWTKKKKKVCGTVPWEIALFRGALSMLPSFSTGALWSILSLPGLPLNLLIKLFFKDQHIREGMTLPTRDIPKRRTNILKLTCNYYVNTAAERETES